MYVCIDLRKLYSLHVEHCRNLMLANIKNFRQHKHLTPKIHNNYVIVMHNILNAQVYLWFCGLFVCVSDVQMKSVPI